MLLYPTVDENKIKSRIDFDHAVIGEQYTMLGVVRKESFNGKENMYFYETMVPRKEISLMTQNDGKPPFAVWTNDGHTDAFTSFQLSKILVNVGYHFIIGYRKENEPNAPIEVMIFHIDELNVSSNNFGMETTIVTLKEKSTISESIDYDIFNPAVEHIHMLIDKDFSEYLVPRFSYNPGRVISVRLFQRQGDDLVSYLDSGKKMVINKKSKLYDENINTLFARCFFSKKFQDRDTIIVDGHALPILQEYDLEMYIEHSNLTESMGRTLLKKVTTTYGFEFYVVINFRGEIRPIYKTAAGFLSFPLNAQEQGFIARMEDVIF